MSNAVLTLEEYELKSRMKKLGILRKFKNGELRGLTSNGGVAIVCGDGDIDVMIHHMREISHRPHCKSDFGGVLQLIPSFRGFDWRYAACMAENIRFGFFAKQTETIFAYFHYPCGAALHYDHSFTDILRIMADSPEVLKLLYNFERVYVFLHVRRLNKNREEKQNTYLVEADMLKRAIQDGVLD